MVLTSPCPLDMVLEVLVVLMEVLVEVLVILMHLFTILGQRSDRRPGWGQSC